MAIVATVILGPRVFTTGPSEAPEEVVVAAGAPGAPALGLAARPAATGDRGDVVLATPAPAPPAPPTTEATTTTTVEATTTTIAEEAAPSTTEVPAPPTTAAPTTTAPPTTTTSPPPPSEPEPAPAALSAIHGDGAHEGLVSWYDLPGARAGVCAHRTIERGTVVTVTNLDTGQSIACTVDDRGPYSGDEKILDLHKDDFSRLAPLGQGVFPARLVW